MSGLAKLALVVLTVLVYGRSLGNDFVLYDDPGYVTENPVVSQGLSAEGVAWAFTSTDYQYNWHPVTWVSHMLDVTLFGMEPGGHHAAAIALHALNALLLCLALRALGLTPWTAWIMAALFAWHPLRVESVSWVAERKDVLSGTFFFLTLLAWARWARGPSAGRFVAVVLALALGLMAKPMLVTVPFVLLLLDGWPLGRWRGSAAAGESGPATSPARPGKTEAPRSGLALLVEKAPLFGLAAVSILVTLSSQSAGGAVAEDLPLSVRLAHAPVAVFGYVAKALWPTNLAVFYPHPALGGDASVAVVPTVLASLGLLLLSGLALSTWRTRPWFAVGWFWFVGMLVPVLGIVQVGAQAMADRYAYLPLIGLQLVLVMAAEELVRKRPAATRPVRIAMAVVLAACLVRTFDQQRHWEDSETLFTHALAVTERNSMAANNLGMFLGQRGELEEAARRFEEAVTYQPGFHIAHRNLGKLRYGEGDMQAAHDAFARAVELSPDDPATRVELAVCLARLGRGDEAWDQLDEVERRDPRYINDPTFQVLRQGLAAKRGGQ